MDIPILRSLDPVTAGEYDPHSDARPRYTGAEDTDLRTSLSHAFSSLMATNSPIDRLNTRSLRSDVSTPLAMISDVVGLSEELRLALLNREIAGSASSETPIVAKNDIICAVQRTLTSWERLVECEDEFGHYASFCMECEDELEVALKTLIRCLVPSDL